jgi:hypothetical protein
LVVLIFFSQQHSRLPNVISVALTTYSLSAVSHVLQTPGGLLLPNEVSTICLFIYRKLLLYTHLFLKIIFESVFRISSAEGPN